MRMEALRQELEAIRAREDAAFEDGRDATEAIYESAMKLAEKCIGLLEAGPVHITQGVVSGPEPWASTSAAAVDPSGPLPRSPLRGWVGRLPSPPRRGL